MNCIVRSGRASAQPNNCDAFFNQIVLLRHVLPDFRNTRPLDARCVRKQRIVRLVYGFDRAGLAIFVDSHGYLTRLLPPGSPAPPVDHIQINPP